MRERIIVKEELQYLRLVQIWEFFKNPIEKT